MIALACDHAGYLAKQKLFNYLTQKGIQCKDFGTISEESCDYPDFAQKVAYSVTNGECEKGILICGTGIGMSIAANKIKGIRAAVCCDTFSAEMTRRHNNANILCMGARVLTIEKVIEITDIFLSTPFEGGRHQTRIDKIHALEK